MFFGDCNVKHNSSANVILSKPKCIREYNQGDFKVEL